MGDFKRYDLGIVDTDSDDIGFWRDMVVLRPRVIVIECAERDGEAHSKQASVAALIKLGKKKKYTAVARTYCNLIFVANEELTAVQEISVTGALDVKNTAPLAVADNAISEIRASHILQRETPEKALSVVGEWLRALVPGGLLKIAVPDYDALLKLRNESGMEQAVTGTDDNRSASLWWYAKLYNLMASAGLLDIEEWEDAKADTAQTGWSLNLQGRKLRDNEQNPNTLSIAAVCSTPRYGPTGAAWSVHNAMPGVPINYQQSGPWWYCGLEEMLEGHVANKTDIVVVCDFDTMVEKSTFDTMYAVMAQNPRIAIESGQPMPANAVVKLDRLCYRATQPKTAS